MIAKGNPNAASVSIKSQAAFAVVGIVVVCVIWFSPLLIESLLIIKGIIYPRRRKSRIIPKKVPRFVHDLFLVRVSRIQ